MKNYKLLNPFLVLGIFLIIMTLAQSAVVGADYDFEGRTVTIGGAEGNHGRGRVTGEMFEEGEMHSHLQEVEEEFNVNIEFNPSPDPYFIYDWVVEHVLAGDVPADIIRVKHYDMEPLALEGVIQPLDDVLDKDYYNSLPEAHQSEKARSLYHRAGTPYGFSINHSMWGANYIVWNKDMFEREGITSLYELQEEGKWDWDALIEISQDLTRDVDGDGETDQWGIQPIDEEVNATHVTWSMYTNNATPVKEKDNGDIVFSYNEEEAISAIELWDDLINEYEVIPDNDLGGVDNFVEGNVGMVFGDRFMLTVAAEEEMSDEFGIAFFPKGPQAEDYVAPVDPYDMLVLPTTTEEDPEALVELANALFELTDDYSDVENWEEDVKDEYFYPYIQDRESTNVLDDIFQSWIPIRYYLGEGMLFSTDLPAQIEAALAGDESPRGAIEAIEEAVQEHLDQQFDQ